MITICAKCKHVDKKFPRDQGLHDKSDSWSCKLTRRKSDRMNYVSGVGEPDDFIYCYHKNRDGNCKDYEEA